MAEPITLDEAKLHLRVLHAEHDDLIESLIVSAREFVEGQTDLVLVRRTMTEHFDRFPSYFEISKRPVESVDAITYGNATGEPTTIETFIVSSKNPFRIYPGYDTWWPRLGRYQEISVSFTAGYETPDEVPADVKQAIKLLIGHWYENGGAAMVGGVAGEMPFGVEAILSRYRRAGV